MKKLEELRTHVEMAFKTKCSPVLRRLVSEPQSLRWNTSGFSKLPVVTSAAISNETSDTAKKTVNTVLTTADVRQLSHAMA